jgi:hypothetical protein
MRLDFTRAAPEVIEKRRDTCNKCDEYKPATPPLKPFATCANCGCVIAAKTALAAQSCPLKKW